MKKREQPTNSALSNRPTMSDPRCATNPAARQVLGILDAGNYQTLTGTKVSLGQEQAASELGTVLYTPDDLEALCGDHSGTQGESHLVKVLDCTTQVAAHQLAQDGPLVLLNFASARNPGGGFLGGAKAQEEDLCRCSGLYRTLLTQPSYYTVHRRNRSPLYTDHIIYSPTVPFFRTASNAPLLETLFLASVITAPAPNAGAIRRNQPKATAELPATFVRRWTNILAVAQKHRCRTLILGAWGCGAFRNDPKLVAHAAREALLDPRFEGAFSRVIFPIPGSNKHSQINLEAFRSTLSDAG